MMCTAETEYNSSKTELLVLIKLIGVGDLNSVVDCSKKWEKEGFDVFH